MTEQAISKVPELRRQAGELLLSFQRVRAETETLAAPILPEDAQIQSMPDGSPTKWHLGHTSWFFETFLLESDPRYQTFQEDYKVLFNSYYNAVGRQHPRPQRGMLGRPPLEEVFDYRRRVDEGMTRFLGSPGKPELEQTKGVIKVGLHHEQQHQELILTDILHVYWSNPLRPAYREDFPRQATKPPALGWHRYPEGIYWIGSSSEGFAFDNEYPRHREFIHDFELASRLVTCSEYMNFVSDGGYERPELWLSDGWATIQEQDWEAPLYWERRQGAWWRMTLYGMHPVDPHAPVCHVSYYEADAFARWAGARLPTEAEWEVAAVRLPVEGNFRDSENLVPLGVDTIRMTDGPQQMFGDVWEWTTSAYAAYPGYRAGSGALGEYNGKFMCNQMVLRGGSLATPRDHLRASYRNFFPADARWQFMGIRLARDV